MKLEFWTKLRDYCERKMAQFYLASWKCPHCLRFTHTTGGAAELWHVGGYDVMKCKWCNRDSKWRVEGPIAFTVPMDTQVGSTATVDTLNPLGEKP